VPEQSRPGTPRRLDGTVGFGLVLITVGVVLTLDNLDIVSASELLSGWWPVAVIAVGLWVALRGSAIVGVLVAAIGGLLLLSTQDVITASVGRLVGPGVLVVLGGTLLQAGRRVQTAQVALVHSLDRTVAAARGGADVPTPAATAILGDAHLVVDDAVPEARRVLVSATSVLGDVRIEVPAGWQLEDHITRILGDVRLTTRRTPAGPGMPVVELHGVALLGDIRVTERAGGRT
jgi:hypothetical protein